MSGLNKESKRKSSSRKTSGGTTSSTGKKKKAKTPKKPRVASPRQKHLVSLGPEISSTTKTGISKRGDANAKKALPKNIVCNGLHVVNPFKSTVTVARPGLKITVYLSSYDENGNSVVTKALVKAIEDYAANGSMVGCVAWLSNTEVLNAAAKCRRAMLIVNSEHFDDSLKEKYDRIPNWDEPLCVAFSHMETPIKALERGRKTGRSAYKSVRCFGTPSFTAGRNANGGGGGGGRGRGTSGLLHNKYLVFFEKRPYKNPDTGETVLKDYPCAVWTGSANMTKLSEKHDENTQLIENDEIAQLYFDGWAQTFMKCSTLESASKKANKQKQTTYKRRYRAGSVATQEAPKQFEFTSNDPPGPRLWSPGLYH